MIEIGNVRIYQDIPGVDDKYVLEYRIHDPAKGRHVVDGFEVWKYDKSLTFSDNDLNSGIERLEEMLTERLSS